MSGGLAIDVRLERPGFSLAVRHAFAPAGLTALFGRSGAGKSTVLRIIAGLERSATGTITFAGESWQAPGHFIEPEHRRIGFVFQDARLFAHLSVRDNLAYGLRRAAGLDGPPLEAVAEMLGLTAFLDRSPATLSGGERQRVALGRALLARPRLLLMDEPLAALDAARKNDILPHVERLRDETRLPILFVSHSVSEVARLADTITVMEQGRIVLSGAASGVLADPSAVAHFGVREAGAVLDAGIVAHHPDGVSELATGAGSLYLPTLAMAQGTGVRVRILAQDVMIALERPSGISALNVLPVTIMSLHEGAGPGVLLSLRAGPDTLLARVTRRSADMLGLRAGLACHAVLKSVSVAQADIGANPPNTRPDARETGNID